MKKYLGKLLGMLTPFVWLLVRSFIMSVFILPALSLILFIIIAVLGWMGFHEISSTTISYMLNVSWAGMITFLFLRKLFDHLKEQRQQNRESQKYKRGGYNIYKP